MIYEVTEMTSGSGHRDDRNIHKITITNYGQNCGNQIYIQLLGGSGN